MFETSLLGWRFNAYLIKMGGVVDMTATDHKNAGNRHLWDDFDETRERTKAVRAADHGKYLVAAAKAKLDGKMTLITRSLGTDPVDTSKKLETLDWGATASAAKKAGVPKYEDETKNFYNDFYLAKNAKGDSTGDAKAGQEHHVVIRTYKKSIDRSRVCR